MPPPPSPPPRLALWLLSTVLALNDRDAILGDLIEEFEMQSSAWFWLQTLRSIGPTLAGRWRQGELQETILLPVLLVMLPFRALDLLWTYILSNVPLRTAADRPLGFLLISLAIAGAGSLIAGRIAKQPFVGAIAAIAVAICLITARGPVPAWFAILSLLLAAASGVQRRST